MVQIGYWLLIYEFITEELKTTQLYTDQGAATEF
jgi:hypothetical protein